MNTPIKVLLIDDDETANFMNKRTLRKMHLAEDVIVTTNGDEAIKYLSTTKKVGAAVPDIILLDLDMPIMDGWAFLEAYDKLRLVDPQATVVVILSTSLRYSDIKLAEQHPLVASMLSKPLRKSELEQVLKQQAKQLVLAETV